MALIKWVFGSDNHGDMASDEAIGKFLQFTKDFKPKYKIHGGDGMDLRCYRKGASAEEKGDGIRRDVQAHLLFLDKFRPHVFIKGNHDDRLDELADRGKEDSRETEIAQDLRDKLDEHYRKMKLTVIPYSYEQGRNDYWLAPEGGPKFAHGRHHNMHMAKAHYDLYEGPVVTGHGHRHNQWQGRSGIALSVPALADPNKLRYDRNRPGKWLHRQGWGFGVINEKTGKGEHWVVKKEGGIWISPLGQL